MLFFNPIVDYPLYQMASCVPLNVRFYDLIQIISITLGNSRCYDCFCHCITLCLFVNKLEYKAMYCCPNVKKTWNTCSSRTPKVDHSHPYASYGTFLIQSKPDGETSVIPTYIWRKEPPTFISIFISLSIAPPHDLSHFYLHTQR